VHPLGKSPVLTDGDNTLAESAAIIEYLVSRYGNGKLRPAAGSKDELKYNYWLHYAEGSAMPPLLLSLIFTKLPKQPVPFFIKPILKAISNKFLSSYVNPQLRLHTSFMESELAKSTWFAGNEFSAADIQMSFPIEAAAARGEGFNKNAKLVSFLERIHARPAYKRALEKGGPFSIL
jgi:glutathione S-transferase